MDKSSLVSQTDVLSIQLDEAALVSDEKEESDALSGHLNRLKLANSLDPSNSQSNDIQVVDRSGKMQPSVDVAEIIRRWTHALEETAEFIAEITSKMSYVQLDKSSAASQALKLSHLFTLNPNSSGKAGNFQKRHDSVIQNNLTEAASEKNLVSQILADNHSGIASQELKKSMRQAALSNRLSQSEASKEILSTVNFSLKEEIAGPDNHMETVYDEMTDAMNDLALLSDFAQVNGFLFASSSTSTSASQNLFYDIDGSRDYIFSSPLLIETSLSADTYEDLLDPTMKRDPTPPRDKWIEVIPSD